MQGRVIEWVVSYLLSKLDKDTAAEGLVAILRAGVQALTAVAAKTDTTIDDAAAKRLGEVVEEIAKALKV